MDRRLFPILFAVLAAGCGKGNFSAKANAAAGSTLRIAIHTQPTTLDPALVQDVDTGDLVQNIYEGLVAYGEDNKIKPMLAESWTVEDGGKTYVFKIRKAKFHNGREITAGDFKWTFERNADPKLRSPITLGYLGDIVGIKERGEGKATEISGVTAPDDRTLRITLDKPRPYFLGKLTYPCGFVLAKEVVGNTEINSAKTSVGTGPFTLAEYVPAQQVDLKSFPDYWDGAPKIDRYVRPVIQDAQARLGKFRNGELDMLTLERQDLAAVDSDAKLKPQLRAQPRPAIYYLGMNQGAYAPFKDKRVRRAFAMAVDRKKIADDLVGLPLAGGLVPVGVPGSREDLAPIPYDPEGARALIAQAGFPGGKGLPALTIHYREGRPDSQLLAVAAAQDLEKNIGLKVQPRSMEWRSFLEARNQEKLPFYGASWYGDYLDPQNFLSFLLRTGASENHDGYSNPAFDELVDQGDTMEEGPDRLRIYQTAEDILLDDTARIPVYMGRDMVLVSPRLQGLRYNLLGTMPMSKVTLAP
ncbi:peptide ABC transporter substrate-binding protein [bacterium]|nr:MAG: peptide ABC transporter substrate-binding protein [bacterium]